MSIVAPFNWRPSVLGQLRFPALGEQHLSTLVAPARQPIWPAEAQRSLGRSLRPQPDVTMLAVFWGRQAG